MGFDPGGVGLRNGRYFGFPYSLAECDIVVLGAPWDVTTSYRDGTSDGPAAVLGASAQLDFVSPLRPRAWEARIGTAPVPESWLRENRRLRPLAKEVIKALEDGKPAPAAALKSVNEGCARFHSEVEAAAIEILRSGKKLVTLGGDHSVSRGPMLALGATAGPYSVLHIDAHADLREEYEGFRYSHASIMHDVHQFPFVDSLVQLGLRDLSPQELDLLTEHPKIHAFTDWDLRRNSARGFSWEKQCAEIIRHLGPKVYLSLDVDGLDPKYCPDTGTPVPGGLELWELQFLLEEVERSGREFVGADLVEVAPGAAGNEWNANVGARLLFQLCQILSARPSDTKAK